MSKLRIMLLSAGLGIALLLTAYSVYQSTMMRLVSVTPKNNSDKVSSTDPITFTFNHPLEQIAADRFSIEPFAEGSRKVSGNSLVFTPTTSFQLSTAYTATLTDPRSTNGKKGATATTKFTVKYIPFTDLSPSQQNEEIKRTDVLQNTNPLAGALPHNTLDYSLSFYLDSSQKINYLATVNAFNRYPNDEAYTARYNSDVAKIKQSIYDYIKSRGVDPNSIPIYWDPGGMGTLPPNFGQQATAPNPD